MSSAHWRGLQREMLSLNKKYQQDNNSGTLQKLLLTVTHIMGLVRIGVSVQKYSKSNKLIHVAEHRTCKVHRSFELLVRGL